MASYLFCDIDLLDAKGHHTPHAYVGVDQGIITYVGTSMPRQPYEHHYQGSGKLLMPGLYNAHAHAPMTLLRGLGENLPLDRWLNEAIFPFEACMSDEDCYYATLVGIAEMLRFGVVSFSDMYFHSEDRSRAILETGIKCNLGHSVLCFDQTATYYDLPEYHINENLIRTYQGAGNGRLLIDFNLHAEYTSTPSVVKTLAQAAQEAKVRMQVHVSETASEVAGSKERHGMSPVAYLDACGLFDVPTLAAHGVWLSEEDVAILSQKGVVVATCPASNAKLGSGVASVRNLIKAGVTVALGTDGVASNNNHNMFQDMYLLALMERAHKATPMGLSSTEIIEISTRNGALAQGRFNCGDVVLGNRADLIVLDIDTPWMQPSDDMAGAIIYSAQGSDVSLTMVDGQILYQDGEYPTIDLEKALAQTLKARHRILAQL